MTVAALRAGASGNSSSSRSRAPTLPFQACPTKNNEACSNVRLFGAKYDFLIGFSGHADMPPLIRSYAREAEYHRVWNPWLLFYSVTKSEHAVRNRNTLKVRNPRPGHVRDHSPERNRVARNRLRIGCPPEGSFSLLFAIRNIPPNSGA